MRKSCRLLAGAMEVIAQNMKPGITGLELDRIAESYIRDNGAIPAFKGYSGYPATLCISFNEQVVHGIPNERTFQDGDLIGIDVGAVYEEFNSDMARTFYIGENPDDQIRRLIDTTKRALDAGIEMWKPGNRVGDVSHAIQIVIEKEGFSVVRALVGHGIGREMHEEPQIPNFGPAGAGPIIKEGMAAAIEPMVNIGTFAVKILRDGWTYVTADGKMSCHFENTVIATKDGNEILTLCEGL